MQEKAKAALEAAEAAERAALERQATAEARGRELEEQAARAEERAKAAETAAREAAERKAAEAEAAALAAAEADAEAAERKAAEAETATLAAAEADAEAAKRKATEAEAAARTTASSVDRAAERPAADSPLPPGTPPPPPTEAPPQDESPTLEHRHSGLSMTGVTLPLPRRREGMSRESSREGLSRESSNEGLVPIALSSQQVPSPLSSRASLVAMTPPDHPHEANDRPLPSRAGLQLSGRSLPMPKRLSQEGMSREASHEGAAPPVSSGRGSVSETADQVDEPRGDASRSDGEARIAAASDEPAESITTPEAVAAAASVAKDVLVVPRDEAPKAPEPAPATTAPASVPAVSSEMIDAAQLDADRRRPSEPEVGPMQTPPRTTRSSFTSLMDSPLDADLHVCGTAFVS
jgi:hypothetical protein